MIPRAVYESTLLRFFAPIRPYLEEDGISEIMINGPHRVFIERGGRIERTPVQFASHEALMSGLRNLAQYVGRHFDAHSPILEAHLPDGSRVEAVIPPAAPDGPNVAIRRFYRDSLTAQRLVELGSMSQLAMDTLAALVGGKQNIIVAGGTASGKTSLLNVLSAFARDDERIVVIEDSRELQLNKSHVVHLEAQPPDGRGRGEVSVRALFKATLRMRPDRIVVGEIRGGEALDLVQAMTSGHGGCMSTVHASHASDTVNRLETMAMMSDVAMPLSALRAQVASAIDFVVHAARLADGSRCVTAISEVLGYDRETGYDIRPLFERRYEDASETGKLASSLEPTGYIPRAAADLRASGLKLPAALYEVSAQMAEAKGNAS